jgi:hypothetical protein
MENKQSFQNVLFKAIYENSENKLFKESFDPEHLEEGWKDNLKKGLATAALAGSLMAGNAQAADKPMDFNDGAQKTGQFTAFADEDRSPIADLYQAQNDEIETWAKEHGFVKGEDGIYTDKNGYKFNDYDIEGFMTGYNPFGEAVSVPHYEDNPNADMLYQDDFGAEAEGKPDWYQMWQDSQLQTAENEHFLDYIKRLRDNY